MGGEGRLEFGLADCWNRPDRLVRTTTIVKMGCADFDDAIAYSYGDEGVVEYDRGIRSRCAVLVVVDPRRDCCSKGALKESDEAQVKVVAFTALGYARSRLMCRPEEVRLALSGSGL